MGTLSLMSLPSGLAVQSKRCFEEESYTSWPLIWKDSFGVSVKPRLRGPRWALGRAWWEAGGTLREDGSLVGVVAEEGWMRTIWRTLTAIHEGEG